MFSTHKFLVFLLAAPLIFSQKKEIVDLNREVGELQDQVRKLQSSQDSSSAELRTLIQQNIASINDITKSLAGLSSLYERSSRDQQSTLVGPMANLNSRLDSMTQSFQELRESILDMNSRMQKMDAKMNDLRQAVDLGNQRPAPPPSGVTASGVTTPAVPTGPPAGMQAETTYTNAYRDYSSGNPDLALQEFSDFLKYYPSTQLAPNAQYYVGDIYYQKGDFQNAVQAFDAVLEHYSETNKTPDAHFMKGLSLLKLSRRDAAAKEFREVVNRYPASDLAAKAKQKLKELGLSAGAAPAPKPRKRR